jgi:iron donor protein CyaY
MSLDETTFRRIVTDALRQLSRRIDAIESDAFDARLSDGVLQVDFEVGGTFVLSQQVPVRELWLSAFSRAWHFCWSDAGWTERDTGVPLEDVLSVIWQKKLGFAVDFRR